MGLHGSITSQMFMDKVFVPENMRLWPEGDGWRVLADVSNPMRVWGAASLALGTAQGVLNDCLEHAAKHRLFSEQGIAFVLADMEMNIEACRSLNYRVCRLVEDHRSSARQVESMVSMAKCFAADTAMKVADLAYNVLGNEMAKADNASAQLFRAAKGIQIFRWKQPDPTPDCGPQPGRQGQRTCIGRPDNPGQPHTRPKPRGPDRGPYF